MAALMRYMVMYYERTKVLITIAAFAFIRQQVTAQTTDVSFYNYVSGDALKNAHISVVIISLHVAFAIENYLLC